MEKRHREPSLIIQTSKNGVSLVQDCSSPSFSSPLCLLFLHWRLLHPSGPPLGLALPLAASFSSSSVFRRLLHPVEDAPAQQRSGGRRQHLHQGGRGGGPTRDGIGRVTCHKTATRKRFSFLLLTEVLLLVDLLLPLMASSPSVGVSGMTSKGSPVDILKRKFFLNRFFLYSHARQLLVLIFAFFFKKWARSAVALP